MANQQRKKIEPQVEVQVLVECRRRCCLCVFLEGNTNFKNGQIAHIDGNRANNKKQNLVWLCLEHHNQYDSRTSQSKNITANEIRHYREILLGLFKNKIYRLHFHPQMILPPTIKLNTTHQAILLEASLRRTTVKSLIWRNITIQMESS